MSVPPAGDLPVDPAKLRTICPECEGLGIVAVPLLAIVGRAQTVNSSQPCQACGANGYTAGLAAPV